MRFRALVGIAGSAAVAFALSACASAAPSTSTAADAGPPVEGGTLVFAQQIEPGCLDPTIFGDMNQATFASQILDSLVTQDSTGKILPWLADSWTISEDGLVYTFDLKSGVKFTDGTPFNAAAVKATFDYILSPDGGLGGSSSQYLTYVASTDVIDDSTVQVTLSRPFSPFLAEIAQSFVGIQSPTALAKGKDENCKKPVGTGPFYIDSYTPGDQVVLKKNTDYNWAPPTADHQGPAYVDEVLWRFIPDETTRYAAVANKQADASDGLSPINESAAARDGNLSVLAHDYPGNPWSVIFNQAQAPFNDEKVRKAFTYATDVQAGLDAILFGRYERTGILSPTSTWVVPELADAYGYDLDKANKLLDEAGWTGRDAQGYRTKAGKRLSVEWTYVTTGVPEEYATFAQQIQASTKEAGFEVTLNQVSDWAGFTAATASQKSQLYFTKYTLNSPDVLRVLYGAEPGTTLNPGNVTDPDLIAAVNEAAQTTDDSVREALYAKAQKIFSDGAYGIPLFEDTVRVVTNTRTVHGVRLEPTLGLVNLQDAWVTK